MLDLQTATASAEVPIALFYGLEDPLVEERDIAWLMEQIESSIVYSEGLSFGHLGFMIASDMTYFTERAMGQIK